LRDISLYLSLTLPASFVGLAVVLAVIRANKDDLPDIVHAVMRTKRRKRKRKGHNPEPLLPADS
jgi:hypothetical protein